MANPPTILDEKPTQNGHIRLERFADADKDEDVFRVVKVTGAEAPPPPSALKDKVEELHRSGDENAARDAFKSAVTATRQA